MTTRRQVRKPYVSRAEQRRRSGEFWCTIMFVGVALVMGTVYVAAAMTSQLSAYGL